MKPFRQDVNVVKEAPCAFTRLGRACVLGSLLAAAVATAHAGPLVTTDSPLGFFTNMASRLLSSQLGMDLSHLQVYPTNQYTPAVHRLLQVAANVYEAATNRSFVTSGPRLPSVFRPLFRREASGAVFIAAYREATDDTVARFTGSGPLNVVLGVNQATVPVYGAAFSPSDALEPLVLGIPLVIGAREGLPNFNEFAMQTQVLVTRMLQFLRQSGSNTGPIVETNQMYLASITNTWGIEAWNSYLAAYPRSLELRMSAMMVAVVTDEFGTLLLSNGVPASISASDIPANAWTGFSRFSPSSPLSFKASLSGFLFLTNSMFSDSQHRFVLPGLFEHGNGFPVPHWYLSLRPMVRFALVDISVFPTRIVDYVSLDSPPVPVDVAALASSDGQCGTFYTIDGSPGSMWCTNRGSPNLFTPTYGILNQIYTALGDVNANQWPASAHHANIDFFRTQFGLSPLYYPVGTFSQTNIFNCSYSPARAIALYTRWQANDPLVHYTLGDLTDGLSHNPSLELDTTAYSSLAGLGGADLVTGTQVGSSTPLNQHYRPWPGRYPAPADTIPATNLKLQIKDPLVRCSDDWDFPTNQLADANWIGRVHRGTPWQTLYLKSSGIDFTTWSAWTGDTLIDTNWDGTGHLAYDASFTLPTNDWRLASLVLSLLKTNDARTLLSVNQPDVPAWSFALDAMTVLSNILTDTQLKSNSPLPPCAALLMSFNSTQAAIMASALNARRLGQPNQRFGDPADVLATPELSVASPWLNLSTTVQQQFGVTEEAYESVPSQLLPRLRPDSIGSLTTTGGAFQVQFTGSDGCAYAVEASSNLVNWTSISTNHPSNGVLQFQQSPAPTAPRRFYRSSLLP